MRDLGHIAHIPSTCQGMSELEINPSTPSPTAYAQTLVTRGQAVQHVPKATHSVLRILVYRDTT